jgi:hypothetical protein
LVRIVSLVLLTLTAAHAACGCFLHHSHELDASPAITSACACRRHATSDHDEIACHQHGDRSSAQRGSGHGDDCPCDCAEGQCVFVATKSSVNVDSINSAPLVSFDASVMVPPYRSLRFREAPANTGLCSSPLRPYLALQVLLI